MAHTVSFRFINRLYGKRRLFGGLAVGVLTYLLLPVSLRQTTRLVLSWDAATFSYLAMTITLITRSTVQTCRQHAALYDEGDWIILAVTLGGAIASFATIIMELAASKAEGASLFLTFGLTATTVILSWAFTHMIFALHYANLYYRADHAGFHGGLIFPGDREPDYRDFIYHAFVIACAAQTADVATASREMRRVTLVQSITAFAFNSAILALMINITASLI